MTQKKPISSGRTSKTKNQFLFQFKRKSVIIGAIVATIASAVSVYAAYQDAISELAQEILAQIQQNGKEYADQGNDPNVYYNLVQKDYADLIDQVNSGIEQLKTEGTFTPVSSDETTSTNSCSWGTIVGSCEPGVCSTANIGAQACGGTCSCKNADGTNVTTNPASNTTTSSACSGTEPSGDGVYKSAVGVGGIQDTTWTYVSSSMAVTGNACKWTCEVGYTKSGNGCVVNTSSSSDETTSTNSCSWSAIVGSCEPGVCSASNIGAQACGGTCGCDGTTGASSSTSEPPSQDTVPSSSVPAFPWIIQGVSYTNLTDVKAKYPGSCVYINGVYAVMGFGPCVAGTSSNSSSAPTQNPTSNPTTPPTSTTSSVPAFPWTIQGVSYTNLTDVKAKYPGSCVYINGVYAVMGFGPCMSGTSASTNTDTTSTSNTNSSNTSSSNSSNTSSNPSSTASVPADCPAMPSNFKIAKPGEVVYGGLWRPASSASTFVGQIPVGAGVALEFPANTSAFAGGFRVMDYTGGSKRYVISRCPGSMVPVDGQDGTVDKNGDGKNEKCNTMGVYGRWVNTSGTTPNYFSGTTYAESVQTTCFLPTTTSLGSSTQATYYINVVNTGDVPVGIQYANTAQLGTFPLPLGNVSTSPTSTNTSSTNSSTSPTSPTSTTSSVPAFPWTIQGVSYTNLADVKAKYPGSCVYINGVYAVMGFGPCMSGTSAN